jgi:hypothetical protein
MLGTYITLLDMHYRRAPDKRLGRWGSRRWRWHCGNRQVRIVRGILSLHASVCNMLSPHGSIVIPELVSPKGIRKPISAHFYSPSSMLP